MNKYLPLFYILHVSFILVNKLMLFKHGKLKQLCLYIPMCLYSCVSMKFIAKLQVLVFTLNLFYYFVYMCYFVYQIDLSSFEVYQLVYEWSMKCLGRCSYCIFLFYISFIFNQLWNEYYTLQLWCFKCIFPFPFLHGYFFIFTRSIKKAKSATCISFLVYQNNILIFNTVFKYKSYTS